MCGEMRIPTPLLKATFNNVSVSMCGVQFLTISWLVLSSWKVVLQERRTSDFHRRNCPNFWRLCLWINEVIYIWTRRSSSSFFTWSCKFPELSFPRAMDWTLRSSPLASQVSRLKPTGLLCVGMDERPGLQCERNARCIAWSHSGRRWPHKKQSAAAATCYQRGSQPSGRLCCGRRWHFRKSALSTDKFKLKVISRS